ALTLAQQRQAPHRLTALHPATKSGQDLLQVLGQPGHALRIEALAVVDEAQAQLLAGHRHQGQRVARLLEGARRLDAERKRWVVRTPPPAARVRGSTAAPRPPAPPCSPSAAALAPAQAAPRSPPP